MINRYQSSIIAVASFVTLNACGLKAPESGTLPRTSQVASITMPVPEKLKPVIAPDKVTAFSLSITPGTCDAGVTGTKVQKEALELTLNGATLADEKVKKGCAYTLIISMGKANAAGTALEKIYLTNDIDGKRTEITADQTRVDSIKAIVMMYPTADGSKVLGLNDQSSLIIPSQATSSLDIEIAIGQNSGTGNTGETPTPGDYDWRAEGQLTDVPSRPFNGKTYSSDFYKDIMTHTKPDLNPAYGEPATEAHETLHGLHSEMRQKTRDNDSFVYHRDGKGMYIAEPKENMADVKNHIGASFRQMASSNYNLYLITQPQSWKNTLYIFDEWASYIATARTAIEAKAAGQWTPGFASQHSDPVQNLAEFMYFCSATILSIKNVDPQYLKTNKQYKAAYAMTMEESVRWLNESRKPDLFPNSKAYAKFQNLQTAPDAAPVRAAIKELMGDAWTKRVMGF
jgi:hypothetical protein